MGPPTGVKTGFTNVNMCHRRNLTKESTGFSAAKQRLNRGVRSLELTQVYYSELTQLYVARRLNITLLREKYMRLNEVIHLACNKLFAGGNLIFERSETNFGEIKMTLVVCRLNLLPALVESILTPGRSQASATLPLKSFRPR